MSNPMTIIIYECQNCKTIDWKYGGTMRIIFNYIHEFCYICNKITSSPILSNSASYSLEQYANFDINYAIKDLSSYYQMECLKCNNISSYYTLMNFDLHDIQLIFCVYCRCTTEHMYAHQFCVCTKPVKR